MNQAEALQRMVLPSQKRKGKPLGGVIQIWVTRACDRACYGCTQGSNLKGASEFITLEQFEQAVLSLKDYFGIVGVFGGNPCLHPKFFSLCEILRKHIPKNRCGLWSNRLFGHGKTCRETFNPAVSNLNCHMNEEAYLEMRRDWPEARAFGLTADSRHSPPYVAIQDVIEDEETRWEMIANCDINKHWSAMIGVFRGDLRGYFCEIAGAQAMLHQHEPNYPDYGLPLNLYIPPQPEWWEYGKLLFEDQIKYHCQACGVPLKGRGELACSENGIEQVSKTHQHIYRTKRLRVVKLVNTLEELGPTVTKTTDYLGNAKEQK